MQQGSPEDLSCKAVLGPSCLMRCAELSGSVEKVHALASQDPVLQGWRAPNCRDLQDMSVPCVFRGSLL